MNPTLIKSCHDIFFMFNHFDPLFSCVRLFNSVRGDDVAAVVHGVGWQDGREGSHSRGMQTREEGSLSSGKVPGLRSLCAAWSLSSFLVDCNFIEVPTLLCLLFFLARDFFSVFLVDSCKLMVLVASQGSY